MIGTGCWMYDYGNGDLGNQGVHAMDIARWFLGQPLPASRIREQVQSHPLLAERFGAFCEHLSRNVIDLELIYATLGAWLALEPIQKRFINEPAATALSSRPYREPFAVPAIE